MKVLLKSFLNLPFVHRQKNAWGAVMHLSTDFMHLCGFYTYMGWRFLSWKGVVVYVHAKSVVTSAALCHLCMSSVMIIPRFCQGYKIQKHKSVGPHCSSVLAHFVPRWNHTGMLCINRKVTMEGSSLQL